MLLLTLFSLGGVIVTPPDLKSKFSVGNSASNNHKTTWLLAFLPNESDGTKFGPCFFIGLDLRDRFARSLLGENGYFIVFWHFRPNFKLILHTSKWILCHQKFLELFIYILGSLQHNFYDHWDCLSWKLIGGVTFTPRASSMIREPRWNRVKRIFCTLRPGKLVHFEPTFYHHEISFHI